MATFITSLPPEIFFIIFRNLNAKDLASLSQVSRSIRDIIYRDEVWSDRCLRVLYHYHGLLGLWQAKVINYGGLLHVYFDPKSLSIIGANLGVPQELNEAPRRRLLFRIDLNEKGRCEPQCLSKLYDTAVTNIEPHRCSISITPKGDLDFVCEARHLHRQRSSLPSGDDDMRQYPPWVQGFREVEDFPDRMELFMMKYYALKMYQCYSSYKKLDLQEPQVGVPIQPGLFVGTYGAHGLEIVNLTYNRSSCETSPVSGQLNCVKVTGDPNIPAGEITFRVDLSNWIVLTSRDQQTLSDLYSLDAAPKHQEGELPPPSQPFVVPIDCHERSGPSSDVCSARYEALGQVSGSGFMNPSWSRGHFVVFDESTFGFLWLDLLSLSIYKRLDKLERVGSYSDSVSTC